MRIRSLLLTLLAGLLTLANVTAQQSARKAAPLADKGVETLIDAGDKLADEGRWNEAVDAYKQAISVDARNVEARIRLGDAYMGASNWTEALVAYKQAVAIAPQNADAQYALGDAYNTMRMHGDAFAPLVRAIQIDPQFAEAHCGIGYAYLGGEQYAKAISFLRSAISLRPDYDDAHYGLALAYLHLDNQKGLDEERKKLVSLNSDFITKLDNEIGKGGLQTTNVPALSYEGSEPAPPPTRASTPKPSSRKTEIGKSPVSSQPVRSSRPVKQKGAGAARDRAAFELAFWDTIKNSTNPEDFRSYLRKYPNGEFADLARTRLDPGPASQPDATTTEIRPVVAESPVSKPTVPRESANAVERTYRGLEPGRTTTAEVEKILGASISKISATMFEYAAQLPARRIYVEYSNDSGTVSQVVVYYESPPARPVLLQRLNLPKEPDARKYDKKGRLVEYFSGPPPVVLTHEAHEVDSKILSLSYLSREAFERVSGVSPKSQTGDQPQDPTTNQPTQTMQLQTPPVVPAPALKRAPLLRNLPAPPTKSL